MPTLGSEKTNQGKQHELRDLFFEASSKVAREDELGTSFCPFASATVLPLYPSFPDMIEESFHDRVALIR